VAQRLVGKICESCKVPLEVAPEVLISLGVDEKDVAEYNIFRGRGCNTCNGTGIKGRIAIFEIMRMTERIKECVLKGGTAGDLRILAKSDGLRTLRRSALLKLKRGETTIEEVLNASIKDVV
jgi:type IV pilus assembly protein PilB